MNKTANLIAHSLLGAIEAQVTGKHVLAGALGAVTGEMTAELISRHLYNKAPSELTESEKKNVAALSQISAGIAGGIIGDSGAAGLSSAEIGRRAVENNYLNNLEVENLVRELAQAEKEGKDIQAIFEKYKGISESNRKAMLEECGNNPVCYLPHIYQMGTGNEEAYENLSGLRFTSYKNGLCTGSGAY